MRDGKETKVERRETRGDLTGANREINKMIYPLNFYLLCQNANILTLLKVSASDYFQSLHH